MSLFLAFDMLVAIQFQSDNFFLEIIVYFFIAIFFFNLQSENLN
jgi:hypothetical protein